MKERPIIFSGNMVKAILEGRKTMTRRVIKPQPDKFIDTPVITIMPALFLDRKIKCPYGQVGDRLWVKETWCPVQLVGGTAVAYKAFKHFDGIPDVEYEWHSSIFMPRWASRITLEITAIRVERLQKITYQDILAEGIHDVGDWKVGTVRSDYETTGDFINLWDSLNAKRGYGWEVNPWVWVISFKRVEGEK